MGAAETPRAPAMSAAAATRAIITRRIMSSSRTSQNRALGSRAFREPRQHVRVDADFPSKELEVVRQCGKSADTTYAYSHFPRCSSPANGSPTEAGETSMKNVDGGRGEYPHDQGGSIEGIWHVV